MSLTKKTFHGLAWSSIEKFTALFIQVLSSILIARILDPSEFGLIGILTVFSSLGNVLIGSGFGQALIRQNSINRIQLSSVLYLNIALGVVIYIMLLLLAPLIAAFFNIPELTKIARWYFLIVPISSIGLIPITILSRELRFRSLALISVISSIISGMLGVYLATQNYGVWSLVLQLVTYNFMRSCGSWLVTKWRPMYKFSIRSLEPLMSFSINLILTGVIGTLFNNIYSVLIGKLFSPYELGLYNQADRFQKVPSGTISSVVQSVTYPALSKIKSDLGLLRRAYYKILNVLFLITLPIMSVLFINAHDMFKILLTDQWLKSADYFVILCLVGVLYPISSFTLNLLNIKGNGKVILKLEITRKVILVFSIILAISYGIRGLMVSMVVFSVIQLLINLHWSTKEISSNIFVVARQLLPIFVTGIFAVLVVYYLSFSFVDFSSLDKVIIRSGLYLFSYVLLLVVTKSKALSDARDVFEKVIKA